LWSFKERNRDQLSCVKIVSATKHKQGGKISVETIVQQIIVELGRNICKRIEEGGISDIDQFASDALGLCKESVRALIS